MNKELKRIAELSGLSESFTGGKEGMKPFYQSDLESEREVKWAADFLRKNMPKRSIYDPITVPIDYDPDEVARRILRKKADIYASKRGFKLERTDNSTSVVVNGKVDDIAKIVWIQKDNAWRIASNTDYFDDDAINRYSRFEAEKQLVDLFGEYYSEMEREYTGMNENIDKKVKNIVESAEIDLREKLSNMKKQLNEGVFAGEYDLKDADELARRYGLILERYEKNTEIFYDFDVFGTVEQVPNGWRLKLDDRLSTAYERAYRQLYKDRGYAEMDGVMAVARGVES